MRYVIVCYTDKSSKRLEQLLKRIKYGEVKISGILREDEVVVVDTSSDEFEEEIPTEEEAF